MAYVIAMFNVQFFSHLCLGSQIITLISDVINLSEPAINIKTACECLPECVHEDSFIMCVYSRAIAQ